VSIVLVGALAAATAAAAAAVALCGPREVPAVGAPVHPDADALGDAGWRHGLIRWEALRCAAVTAAALLTAFAAVPAAVIPLAAVAPSVWVRTRAQQARDRARREHARLLVAIASALRSGLSLPDALRRAARDAPDGLSARALRAALRSFDLGAGLDRSLLEASGVAPDDLERVALGTLALGVAERLPRERLAALVEAVSDRAAFALRLDDEVRARTSGARQQQRLLALLVPALALYLSVTMPSLAATLASDLGRFVLVPAAAMLEVGGILLGGRIVRGAMR